MPYSNRQKDNMMIVRLISTITGKSVAEWGNVDEFYLSGQETRLTIKFINHDGDGITLLVPLDSTVTVLVLTQGYKGKVN